MSRTKETLTMDAVITGLGDIKATVGGGRWDVCQAAVNIFSAFAEEGAQTTEEALDIIRDYRILVKPDVTLDIIHEYRALVRQGDELRQKHTVAGKPFLKDGVWHCPDCNRRVAPNHSFCHRCGKKLGWR